MEAQLAKPVHERQRVLDLVRRHGWNATSFQTLESGYAYFFHGDDACVAYVDTGAAWVAAGPPIAARDAMAEAAAVFARAASAAGKRCCFFGTEERFRNAVGRSWRSLRIGQQPSWDPRDWTQELSHHRSLREQLRRARAKGVRVRRIGAAELVAGPLHDAIARVAQRWLGTRQLAPLGFLVQVEPFGFPEHRCCFVAEIDGRLVGFASVVPVPARDGWFIEDLVRDPDAPNGTSEMLVDAVMRWAADENCGWLTLGLAPLAGNVGGMLQLMRRSTRLLYDFAGLHSYKAKLRPNHWSTIYLSFPLGQNAFVAIVDALAAFTNGGFVRFGMRTLLRGSAHGAGIADGQR
jgi:phosphatidylglycerol lysyltransferase